MLCEGAKEIIIELEIVAFLLIFLYKSCWTHHLRPPVINKGKIYQRICGDNNHVFEETNFLANYLLLPLFFMVFDISSQISTKFNVFYFLNNEETNFRKDFMFASKNIMKKITSHHRIFRGIIFLVVKLLHFRFIFMIFMRFFLYFGIVFFNLKAEINLN